MFRRFIDFNFLQPSKKLFINIVLVVLKLDRSIDSKERQL